MQNDDGQELHRQALQPSARDDVNPYERAPRCDISQILIKPSDHERIQSPSAVKLPLRLQNQQGDKQIYNCVYITTHTPNN